MNVCLTTVAALGAASIVTAAIVALATAAMHWPLIALVVKVIISMFMIDFS